MSDEVDFCDFNAEREFRAAGLEDPARVVLAIFSCPQRGPRMMAALTLYAEGVSARDAAAAVGFRDQGAKSSARPGGAGCGVCIVLGSLSGDVFSGL